MKKNKNEKKYKNKKNNKDKFYYKIKISRFLLLMVILSISFSALMSFYGFTNMKSIHDKSVTLYEDRAKPLVYLSKLSSNYKSIHAIALTQTNDIKKYSPRITTHNIEAVSNLESYKRTSLTPEETEIYNSLKENYEKFYNIVFGFDISRITNNKSKLIDLSNKIDSNIDSLIKINEDIMSQINEETESIWRTNSMLFIIIFAVTLTIQVIISYLIIKSLKVNTKDMNSLLGELAKGNFSINIPHNSRSEFGLMKKALKESIDNISSMMKILKEKTDSIDAQSQNLSSISEEMASSSENVANAIGNVAEGAISQATSLTSVTESIEEFGCAIENIHSSLNEVKENSQEIKTEANSSNENMITLKESMQNVTSTFDDLITKISTLNSNINNITEITSLINDIADQTNLLALNAAIEAARAGEAGKGFAVVSDEIRHLAEQVKEFSEKINSIISNISDDTKIMVSSTETVKVELTEQDKDIDHTIESFSSINGLIQNIIPKIVSVSESASKINNDKNIILMNVSEASSVSEEVSASSQEISASSEEMTASTEEVAHSALELNNMTKEMLSEIEKFKLK
ncbi:methyl-accepting chemotaxis protein [Oceanirhabdus sp. W0125-5]|uniref:methyl-accepting chemotaxis protein n=1 Tax=Oceanirhabdus sp. W0125-5 TaxID=2999116 RepID=UPI0022F324A2|nr:methyl-accepting chemotaxis protein [Oceanirhabdus sp. W0125-5]WBW98409.1 methyl-accepting chemotaxis protein [Oceanirhabdus sp. W0125-5]